MEQLNLLNEDMEVLQEEIWDVHRDIRALEALKDTLYKERQAICNHPGEYNETSDGRPYQIGSTNSVICGICKRVLRTRNF